jgi:hypothetical protein
MAKEVLERVSSPEELDRRLVVVSYKGWVALILTCLLILGAIVWAFLGSIPNYYEAKTIYLNSQGFDIFSSQITGRVQEAFVKINQTISEGDPLFVIEGPSGESWKALATRKGKIIDFYASPGTRVQAGDPLLLIQKEQGQFFFFSFVPIDRGQQLKQGMRVYIKPEGINVEQYGSIVASVNSIAPYVASSNELLKLLGNQSLIPYFTGNEPVTIVTILPQQDPQAPSGFKWSSGVGPPQSIGPQTVGTALFVLQARRPISYAIPIWRAEKIYTPAEQGS